MNLRRIDSAPKLRGQRVLVRVDFNVPVKAGVVTNEFRIKAALPTITFLERSGAKVILMSHREDRESNAFDPVSVALQKYVNHSYVNIPDLSIALDRVEKMRDGEVVLLTNLRFWPGEEMNAPQFAEDLAKLADIYVNDAFASSHRNHASIVSVPKLLPSYVGFCFTKEVEELSKAFNPEHPFLFLLGGAKFETKEPLIRKFLDRVDTLFIGGALANDFFKIKGFEGGESFLSKDFSHITDDIIGNSKILLPSDVLVSDSQKNTLVKLPDGIASHEKVVDAGPQTIEMLKSYINKAKFILWNGPVGVYEEGFTSQTEELAIAIAESEALSIVGGGDTIASIERLSLENEFDFLSTGGGAMLDFLVHETLPGIEALKAN